MIDYPFWFLLREVEVNKYEICHRAAKTETHVRVRLIISQADAEMQVETSF